MLVWTRDAQRLAWSALKRDLALGAAERTPLRLHARRAWSSVDRTLLRFFLGSAVASRALRRWLWAALRKVRAVQAMRFARLWCEWMAFMIVTDTVARWALSCIR